MIPRPGSCMRPARPTQDVRPATESASTCCRLASTRCVPINGVWTRWARFAGTLNVTASDTYEVVEVQSLCQADRRAKGLSASSAVSSRRLEGFTKEPFPVTVPEDEEPARCI